MTARGITKRIGSIKFSCVSPDEIRKMSATKIITADTYDDGGYPIELGLMDLRMGVIEPGLRCKTCGCKVYECPGHFGHIDLAMPVIHVGFIKDIKMLLESTCCSCGRLMLSDDYIQACRERMEWLENLGGGTIDIMNFSKETAKDASGKEQCPYCGAEQKKISLNKPTTFCEVEDNHTLTPKEVRERLERIPDEDLITLGIDPTTCRPEWMVLTALAVPPVTVRPSITLDSGDRSEDDLTHKLVDVLRINQRLRENRDAGAPMMIVEDLWGLLQYHVTTYFDNQTSGIPLARHRSGRPLKTLAQRLKGKEGRFRSNLSGKRVNFSARTVISPDPLLSINDVGVPIFAARELTVPVHVNEHNIEKVRELVARGPEPAQQKPYIPGVNYVIRSDGRRIRVTDKNAADVAEGIDIDYTVERQLVDGDVVLFNRQPSLHRMSMMAHKVRIINGRTFTLNPSVCPPYGADFDGDEMNLHILQSDEARAEARILMQVQENILSPRYGGPIIGAIHDHITGAYFLTHNNPRFDRFQAMNVLFKLNDIEVPAPQIDEKGEEYWNGKDLFSIVLPEDFRITFKANICQNCKPCQKEECPYDAYVKIRDGKLLCGTIDVKAIGNSKGKILDHIARDYGSDRAAKFINQVTRLALGALMNHGFSIGVDDMDVPPDIAQQITNITQVCIDMATRFAESYNDGTLEPVSSHTQAETLEKLVLSTLELARLETGNITSENLGFDNPAVIMANTGARGSMLSLSQITGCIGQQAVRGVRPSRGYHNRTLPHFEKGDLGAYARGFCSNSYKSGLSPTEYFFHAIGGRSSMTQGLIETQRSGYMQRRLVSALEDLKLTADGTVRNTIGTVVQFKYGEDGVNPARSVRGKAVDLDDVFATVLGDDADALLHVDTKDVGGDYGSLEKDEMEYYEEESEFDEFSDEYDSFEENGSFGL